MQPDILDIIFEAHCQALPGQRLGIVFCGSIVDAVHRHENSDIDFVVLVDELSPAVLKTLGAARSQLADTLQSDVSNTVISIRSALRINTMALTLDGKAVQALIEAYGRPERVRSTFNIQLSAVRPSVVSKYSAYNFFVIRSLTLKHIIRTAPNQFDAAYWYKLTKLCLIACKMRQQYLVPASFAVVGQATPIEASDAYRQFTTLKRLKTEQPLLSNTEITSALEFALALRAQDFGRRAIPIEHAEIA